MPTTVFVMVAIVLIVAGIAYVSWNRKRNKKPSTPAHDTKEKPGE